MRSITSRLRLNALAAGADVLLNGLTMLLLYRIMVANLGVDAVGAWAVLTSATAVAALTDIGVGRAVIKFVAQRPEEGRAYLETGMVASALACLIIVLLAYWPIRLLLTATLPPEWLDAILALLPFSLAAFWLANVGGVPLSGLVALHRTDRRTIVTIAGNLAYLLCAVVLVPRLGLAGMAWGLLVRDGVKLAAGMSVLNGGGPNLLRLMPRWSGPHFREMLGYGLRFQLTSVANFLFEPTSRLLLARFGSLEAVGFYELASRLVQIVRSVIVAANQTLIPAFAALRSDAERIALYRFACERTILVTAASMLFLIPLAKPVAELWLGQRAPLFVEYTAILTVAWSINLIAAPSYFLALGLGSFRGVLACHATQAAGTVMFGVALGIAFGATGVVVATAVSTILGAAVGMVIVHRDLGLGRSVLSSMGIGTLFLALLCWLPAVLVVSVSSQQPIQVISMCAPFAMAAMALIAVRHSFRPPGTPVLLGEG